MTGLSSWIAAVINFLVSYGLFGMMIFILGRCANVFYRYCEC